MTDTFRRPRWKYVAIILGGLVAADCGMVSASPQTTATVVSGSSVSGSSVSGSPVSGTSATSLPDVTPTTAGAQPGWATVSTEASGVAVDERTVLTSGGARVTVIRFRAGQVRFALHAGSEEPPTHGVALGENGQPAVAPSERLVLLGAFNGGFKARDSAWGVEINGHVLTPLVPGVASLVIDADGTAHVGVWGATVPAPREVVTGVRQNLAPLVIDSQPSPFVADVNAWGSPLHGVAFQARSALGQDGAGNLIYAASMGALPIDLASALLLAGATTAMWDPLESTCRHASLSIL